MRELLTVSMFVVRPGVALSLRVGLLFVALLVGARETAAQVSYTVVAGFDQSVGAATQPTVGVIKGNDGAYYGTTQNSNFCGAVYKVSPGGTRTVLHVFKGSFAQPPDGPDGCQPVGELVQADDGFLYGVTNGGGPNVGNTIVTQGGTGTIFKISPNGDGVFYQIVHAFALDAGNAVFPEGILPQAGLTLNQARTAFYGTTFYGGTGGPNGSGDGCTAGAGTAGTVYQFTLAGAFSVIHSFDPTSEGCGPMGNLTLTADGSFVGTTLGGPFTQTANYAGAVFRVTPTSFDVLFRFPGSGDTGCPYGGAPVSAPVEKNENGTVALYGANSGCGFANDPGTGTLYKLTQPGSVWQPSLLHRFTGPDGANPRNVTLDDGGNFLYGVTPAGGAASNGTVFRIPPTGGTPTTLHTFTCIDTACTTTDPNDGFGPEGRLLESSPGEFIGTTRGGNGSTIGGSVFRIETCAVDRSASISVTSQGQLKLNRKTGRSTQTLTLKNGDGAVAGPISLVLESLSSNAALFNRSGTTVCLSPGSPYINIDIGPDGTFSPRERASVTLEFDNPSGQAITYTTRVLVGAGSR